MPHPASGVSIRQPWPLRKRVRATATLRFRCLDQRGAQRIPLKAFCLTRSLAATKAGRIGNPSYGFDVVLVTRTDYQSVLRFIGQRDTDLDRGSLAGAGRNPELAATERTRSSMLASPRPDRCSPAAGSMPRPKSRTSRSRNSTIGIQCHVHSVRLGVLDRIAQGLLGDPVQAQGQISGHTGRQLAAAEVHGQPSAVRYAIALQRRASLSPRSSKIAGCSCRAGDAHRPTRQSGAVSGRPAGPRRLRRRKSCSTFPASTAPAASRCEMSSCNSRAIRLPRPLRAVRILPASCRASPRLAANASSARR